MNRNRSPIFFHFLIAALVLTACATPAAAPTNTAVPPTSTPLPPTETASPIPPTLTSTPVPTDTPIPPMATAIPSLTPKPGDTLLSDTFDDNHNRWPTYDTKDSSSALTGGHLVLTSITSRADSLLPGTYSDTHVTFEAAFENGDNSTVVLIAWCRNSNDINSGYFFFVAGTGELGAIKLVNGAFSVLKDFEYPAALETGQAANLIEVNCVGSQLQLIANHKLVVSISDDSLTKGQIGLGSINLSNVSSPKPAVVTFDNFRLLVPDPAQLDAQIDEGASLAEAGLVLAPTAVQGKTNTIFPVPSGVSNYVDYGDGVLQFDTSLSLKDLVAYYRDILSQNGLTEEADKTVLTKTTVSMVFDSPTDTSVWMIDGVSQKSGLIEVKIRNVESSALTRTPQPTITSAP